MRLYKHGKSALLLFQNISLKIRANLKRHNRVYILSSKITYRPMRARVVAQLFYNTKLLVLHFEADCDLHNGRQLNLLIQVLSTL